MRFLRPGCPRLVCLLLALLAAGAWPAKAQVLRLCVLGQAHPPYLYMDREGSVQMLLRLAAERIGLRLDVHRAPPVRCRQGLVSGLYDAVAPVAYTPTNHAMMLFPMAGKAPNPAYALFSTRFRVLRRMGDLVQWDGHRFIGLRRPVLSPAGYAAVTDRLHRLGVNFDDGGRQEDSNVLKLVAERGDAAIVLEVDIERVLQTHGLAGQVEALPVPFLDEAYYVGVSPTYQADNAALVEQYWQALARVRKSPEYQELIRALR